ncbi:MAG: phage holin family protein [Candidatus Kapaibacteriota bacterium]|jgi:putative membrane protein
MTSLFIRWGITASAVYLTQYLVDGIWVKNFFSAIIASVFIGFLNTFLKPILALISLPIVVISLGLFMFVINAGILLFAGQVLEGIEINGFAPAFWGSIIISIGSWIGNSITK